MDGHHRDRKFSCVELVSNIACMPACMSVAISVNCEKKQPDAFLQDVHNSVDGVSTEHAVSWNA